jgi:DNA-binding response OmpR family regulator
MRLLVIEDHDALAQMIAWTLQQKGYVVDRAKSIAEAQAAIAAVKYDLLLLDRQLPDGDGIEMVRSMRASSDHTPVIAITGRQAIADRVLSLNAGADDYLGKPFAIEELVARVAAILRRPAEAVPNRLRIGNLALDQAQCIVLVDGRPVSLPRREFLVLGSLIRHRGVVVQRDELWRTAYSLEEAVNPNTLDVQISRIRRRLASLGAKVQIETLRGVGYRIVDAVTQVVPELALAE